MLRLYSVGVCPQTTLWVYFSISVKTSIAVIGILCFNNLSDLKKNALATRAFFL
jgi:hypothetical protein